MKRWKTVVPIHGLTADLKHDSFAYGPGVTISGIPKWLREDELLKDQSKWDLDQLLECKYCLIYDYEAEALGSPDPDWNDRDRLRSIQAAKSELSYLANLSLWVRRPCPISFSLIFHAPECSDVFCIQQTEKHDHFLCHPNDSANRICFQDLQPASQLYSSLIRLPRQSAPWTACRAVTAALQMNHGEIPASSVVGGAGGVVWC